MAEKNADRPVTGGANAGPAALPPLVGSTLVLGTIALSLATFMNVLDLSLIHI